MCSPGGGGDLFRQSWNGRLPPLMPISMVRPGAFPLPPPTSSAAFRGLLRSPFAGLRGLVVVAAAPWRSGCRSARRFCAVLGSVFSGPDLRLLDQRVAALLLLLIPHRRHLFA